jgi:DNA-binding CsgD family transcriptional regulator
VSTWAKSTDRVGMGSGRDRLARAHLLFGEWLRRAGRRVDARAQLRLGHEMFTDMGMEGFAERARHERLANGETVRRRKPETSTELTPQEAQIAQLARAGLTNADIGGQLFLSPRMVEWHLKKVFGKLGITSRKGPIRCPVGPDRAGHQTGALEQDGPAQVARADDQVVPRSCWSTSSWVRGGELRGKEQYRRRSAKAALRVCFALINSVQMSCTAVILRNVPASALIRVQAQTGM